VAQAGARAARRPKLKGACEKGRKAGTAGPAQLGSRANIKIPYWA
jgi:hypothetical protein